MFRPMRRINQKLEDKECIKIIEKSKRGHLALLGDNEYPYVIPLDYVYHDEKIYFHGALEGHKVDSIRKSNKASFSIMDEGVKLDDNWYYTFKNVICFGLIKEINDDELIIKVLELFGEKYFPESVSTQDEIDKHLEHTLILELTVEHMSGKLVNEN